ncbi:TMEM165/GDT1 family protein [Halocatena pleomorpha]|uniref:TMEM165/GDT1 family protein n=1 Tax=Halocatena pleomorpha TaxID=1785090 RepID=A0A3P3RJ79_9EURY|nr:TMEM165/GDT1 family protein [Halocatena pleomorpha]RRJ33472.1 TMEM165/GDT1 family protein [Halocatena pleomorpha]
MTGFLSIIVIAAVTQLTVLPGEKGQVIIAGLSTRYKPLVVVGAAATAFGVWTVFEILFGQMIQGLFPEAVLNAITAGLFLLFAVVLFRSARNGSEPFAGLDSAEGTERPSTESSRLSFDLFGHTFDGRFGQFCSIFALMAAGEFGDKTQLITIGLAVQYGATSAIWLGEMIVIIPVSLANAYLFHRFADRFDVRTVQLLGAFLFAFFGADTVLAMATGVSVWERFVGIITNIVLTAV